MPQTLCRAGSISVDGCGTIPAVGVLSLGRLCPGESKTSLAPRGPTHGTLLSARPCSWASRLLPER
jgi:hypothetical protein